MNKIYQLYYLKNSHNGSVEIVSLGNYTDQNTARINLSLFITKNREHLQDFTGFILYGFHSDNPVAPLFDYASLITFLSNGTINDELLIDDHGFFHGRPESRIRYHKGDIVEVYNRYENSFEPAIIDAPPMTEARYSALTSEHPELKLLIDQSDDSYMVYGLGDGDTHDHVMSPFVFPIRNIYTTGIYDALRLKLKEMDVSF